MIDEPAAAGQPFAGDDAIQITVSRGDDGPKNQDQLDNTGHVAVNDLFRMVRP